MERLNSCALHTRMKNWYEDRHQVLLPRRTYTIIRIDGKAFHTFTRGCDKPYDTKLMTAMDKTAEILCKEIQGCRLAYVQSDEISLLLTDFDKTTTQSWFDGNVQKITSISASIATAHFNNMYGWWRSDGVLACFDSRCFTIPDPVEVQNYFVWRQQDATRNSIQMAAQMYFSPKQMNGVNCDHLQENLFAEHGINWNDYPEGFKRGRCVIPSEVEIDGIFRSTWGIVDPPVFTKDVDFLRSRIPVLHRDE